MQKKAILNLIKAMVVSMGMAFFIFYFLFNNLLFTTANSLVSVRLVKTFESDTVYYVNEYGIKIPFPNPEIFLSYGNKWKNIEIISEEELRLFANAKYIRQSGSSKFYLLEGNVKRLLESSSVLLLKVDNSKAVVVNKKEFNFYKTGKNFSKVEAEQFVLNENKQEENKNYNRQICVPEESVGGEDGCKIYEAVVTKDFSICNKITNEEWQAKCYESMIGISEEVLSSCKKISNPSFKEHCINQVALAKRNIQICSELETETSKNFCVSQIEIGNKNLFACDGLVTDSSFQGKNYCLYTFGIINKDIRACNKISNDSEYKDVCIKFISNQNLALKYFKFQPIALANNFFTKTFGIKEAKAQSSVVTGAVPVGGKFLPGAFDIYTPTYPLPCLLVSVVGPNPGTFNFLPIFIYSYFPEAPTHINLNMLGMSRIFPPCPPTLYIVSSGLTPSQ